MGAVRTPTVTTDEQVLKRIERRMETSGCPAATRIHSPHRGGGFSVVCGAIERENREVSEEVRQHVDALVTEAEDPSSIHGYCTTRGYVNCPVWRSELARRERGDERLNGGDVNYGGGAFNRS